MRIESLKPGDVLYETKRKGIPRTLFVWSIRVLETGIRNGIPYALVSWNGNRPREISRVPSTWRRKEPKA